MNGRVYFVSVGSMQCPTEILYTCILEYIMEGYRDTRCDNHPKRTSHLQSLV